MGMSGQQYTSAFFNGNARPAGIISVKNELNEQSWGRLKNMWQRAVTALRSQENKTMLLPAQLDYRALTVSPVDAQIIDMTKLNRSMIAGIFNVPAHMINDLEKATFSNITQQAIQFVRYTMMPWVANWEQELNRRLFTRTERAAGYYVRFNLTGLLRGTPQERAQFYHFAIIRHEFEQKNNELLRQYQAGEIEEALWKQEKELNKKYLEERLSDQQDYYAKADALRNNWNAGLQEGLTNWADSATDYASQAADAVVSTMDGLVSNISDALAGNVVDWRNWGSSILQEVSKILMNAAIVNGLKSLSGAGGWLGTVGGWISGAVANAKGGVYTSANLSAYSNTIVDTPTYFAFAKGAGLMGEAGPEAIMPLTRAADGSLGVRAIGNVNSGGGFVYSPVYHISIQNQGSNGEIDARSARGLVDLIDSRVVSIMQSSRRDGGLYSA